jgi:hypothetical protein
MSWHDDHWNRVAAFPADIQKAHGHSSDHRAEIAASTTCGCFYCCSIFPPEGIEEWVDEVDGIGQTALCPRCGIDSVIGDRGGFPISAEFLNRMKAHWF